MRWIAYRTTAHIRGKALLFLMVGFFNILFVSIPSIFFFVVFISARAETSFWTGWTLIEQILAIMWAFMVITVFAGAIFTATAHIEAAPTRERGVNWKSDSATAEDSDTEITV